MIMPSDKLWYNKPEEVLKMPEIVGVRFMSGHKICDYEVNGIDIKIGDIVVVESDFGLSIGTVIRSQFVENPERELKKIIRIAMEDDIQAYQSNKEIERECKVFCLERIMARGLQMKLVDVEATLDRKRIIFYFTADGRIDFRELVKDLAARYKTRIEMRQIGVRDEAKLAGGIGICGRELCCRTFLTSFEPISIKMIKKKDTTVNVSKLSGLCNRLMCCLRFEQDSSDVGIMDESPFNIDDVVATTENSDSFHNVSTEQIQSDDFYSDSQKTVENEDLKEDKTQKDKTNFDDLENGFTKNNYKNNFRSKFRRGNKNGFRQ